MQSPKEPRLPSFIHWFLDRSSGAHIIVLIFLGFCAYLNAVFHPFVHDDVVFILQNPGIQRWDNIADAFLSPAIPQFFQGLVTPYYRPVLEVLYRFQYALFGFNAHGFHVFNIIFHIANALLVYALFQRIIKSRASAFVVAALFLVHPVQTEAVACVSGISNVACTFFILGALYSYVRLAQTHGLSGGLGFLSTAVGFFILALFTKELAVVFPAICLLYECVVNDKRRSSFVVLRLAVLMLPFLGYMIIRHTLFGGLASAIFENIGELKLRLLALGGTIDMYAGLLVFPSGLHYYRSIDILAPCISSWVVLTLSLILVGLLLRSLPAAERKLALFGLGWFVITLAPVLNIIPLVNEYSFVTAAEHNLYFPSIGFFVFVCVALRSYAAVLNPFLKPVLTGLFAAAIVCFCVLTIRQNTFWKDEITLFQRVLHFEPQLGRVHILLAKAYFQTGRMDDAIDEFNRAGGIMTSYAQKAATSKAKRFYEGMLKGIYSDSAQGYASKRDFKFSISQYDKALALDPNDSYLYSNRALSVIGLGDIPGGMKDLEKALVLKPDNLLAANNLSICYIQQGNFQKAKELLQGILKADPGFIAARDNLNRLNSAKISTP